MASRLHAPARAAPPPGAAGAAGRPAFKNFGFGFGQTHFLTSVLSLLTAPFRLVARRMTVNKGVIGHVILLGGRAHGRHAWPGGGAHGTLRGAQFTSMYMNMLMATFACASCVRSVDRVVPGSWSATTLRLGGRTG